MVEEYWLAGQPSYSPGFDVLFRGDKVIQIETTLSAIDTASGDSVNSRFLDILKRHKSLHVAAYSWEDLNGPAGYVKYFYDDVKAGIAFTLGTQDDQATSQEILSLNPSEPVKPISIIIHPVGQPVIVATGTARVSHGVVQKALEPSFLYTVIKVQDL